MGTWTFPGMRKKIMPLSLLHKRRRKWMGCREKSGVSPADGHSRNAGTPPPRAGRAAAQGTARPGGRAPQASRPTGPGGPVCRPYKNAETCPMNAVGAGPRPARGLLPGVRAFKRSPSSGPLGPPTPFVPSGHFPLIGGIVLPPGRGKAYGRPKAAPTAESGPGALARQSQAQFWNRNNSKFCKPRAQWPGLNSGKPLRFCAPEMLCLAQGVTPVNGVQGVCVIEAGTAKPCLSLCTHPLAALW